MLDKISNISAGSEYSRSAKSNSFNGIIGAAYNKKVDAHDSVNISPALKYLTEVNWKLKEFKHVINEKLYLTFLVSDIEFQTTIDLVNLSGLASLEYRVIKEKKGNNWKSRTYMDLAAALDKIQYDENPFLINFSALNVLFQRIFDLNVFNEITQNDRYMIEELLRDIKFGINDEFNYLNSFLFTFIDKLIGIKIVNNKEAYENSEPIIIKKIKVLNAE